MNLSQMTIKEKELNELKYPLFTNAYYERNCEIIEPLNYQVKTLFKNEALNLKIRIPNCVFAGIFLDDTGSKFVQLERGEEDIFSFKIIEDSFKNENIYIVASFNNIEEEILAYLVTFCL